MRAGNTQTWTPFKVPDEAVSCGFTEAVRGVLSHHMVIRGGKIANYHPYPPTPWNGSVRDIYEQPGPYEDAVQNTPIFEENPPDDFKGIDIMRAVRSFDPCLPCGVHMYMGKGKVLKKLHCTGRGSHWHGHISETPAGSPRRTPPGTAGGPPAVAAAGGDMATRNLREVGDRVEELLSGLRTRKTPPSRTAEELVRLLMELYGAGLERVMEVVAEGSPALVDRIADDQLLASLLVLHGLHPVPVETRIHQALGKAAEVRGADQVPGDRRQRRGPLELENAAQGCPSTAMTVKDAIEKAVSDAAPELGGVELGRPLCAGAGAGARRATARRSRWAQPRAAATPFPSASGGRRGEHRHARGNRGDWAASFGPPPPRTSPSPRRLKRFLETQAPVPRGERCEMCNEQIPEEHSHVVNVESRALMCTCRPCYLLFTIRGAAGGKFASVPDRYLYDPDFALSNAQWDELQIPVQDGVLLRELPDGQDGDLLPQSGRSDRVALLPLDTWDQVMTANPLLSSLDPDVEALIVYRRQEENRYECFLVPIDACYELVGHVRMHWKGFDGGQEAWEAIDGFFDSLRTRARPVRDPASGVCPRELA